MKKQTFAIILIALLIIISGCTTQDQEKKLKIKSVIIMTADKNITINAEIADSYEEREKGLMNRTEMKDNGGMIFMFDYEEKLAFWMKNTLIPLDMIFINSNKTIIDIKHNVPPCTTEECETYISKEKAKYTLEINGGICEKNGVKEGDKIII
jgi:hypothetical protein